jgi:hypothetical protein
MWKKNLCSLLVLLIVNIDATNIDSAQGCGSGSISQRYYPDPGPSIIKQKY